MTDKKVTLGLVVVAIIALGAYTFPKVQTSQPQVIEKELGAAAGPEHTEFQSFLAGSQNCGPGGINATSSTNSSETMSVREFRSSCVIDYTVNGSNTTLTLPASSTMPDLIPQAGNTREWIIRNASTTARNITISGGTGSLLKKATTSAVIYGDTDGASVGFLKATRKTNSDIIWVFDSTTD